MTTITLADGTPVETAYEEMADRLTRDGYTRQGPDGWRHPLGLVLVTIGYSGKQFRIRWCKINGRTRSAQRYTDITTSHAIGEVLEFINMEATQ